MFDTAEAVSLLGYRINLLQDFLLGLSHYASKPKKIPKSDQHRATASNLSAVLGQQTPVLMELICRSLPFYVCLLHASNHVYIVHKQQQSGAEWCA